jgi:hypothetical protein
LYFWATPGLAHARQVLYHWAVPLGLFGIHFYFLQYLGFELRASHLLCRCSTTWDMPPAQFCFRYFWDKVSHFFLGLTWVVILLPLPPSQLGLQACTTTSNLLVEMGVSLTFCLGWPWTMIFLISSSQVVGITRSLCHSFVAFRAYSDIFCFIPNVCCLYPLFFGPALLEICQFDWFFSSKK